MLNGAKIRRLREEKNISADYLAKETGTTHQMITYIEKGLRRPSIELFERIADYFNVSCDYLLNRRTPPPPQSQQSQSAVGE